MVVAMVDRASDMTSRGVASRVKTAMGWGTVPRHFGTISSEAHLAEKTSIFGPALCYYYPLFTALFGAPIGSMTARGGSDTDRPTQSIEGVRLTVRKIFLARPYTFKPRTPLSAHAFPLSVRRLVYLD